MVPTPEEASEKRRANELYWTSDESVNRIAEELGLSKGSLYELVEPRPAGFACPRCGTEMEYPNRTARDRGFLTCPACELEAEEDDVPETPTVDTREMEAVERAERTRVIVGTALLGAAAGLAFALWTRRD